MAGKTSKTCWQGFERYIAKSIGGNRSYGQSAKGRVSLEASALGDVRNAKMLIECKLRDYASNRFRQKYPRRPYNKFRLLIRWYDGVKREANKLKQIDGTDRCPAVAIKAKYGTDDHVVIMYPINDDYERVSHIMESNNVDIIDVTECPEHKMTHKSITLDLNGTFPVATYIDDEHIFIMKLKQFLECKEIWQSKDQQSL